MAIEAVPWAAAALIEREAIRYFWSDRWRRKREAYESTASAAKTEAAPCLDPFQSGPPSFEIREASSR
jgi:hypothetical protein